MTRRKVVVFGNGELAQLTHHYLTRDAGLEVTAFTVDGAFITQSVMLDLPVVPFESVEAVFPPEDHAFALFVGYRDLNHFRAKLYENVKAKGYKLVSYVHSSAMVSSAATIGDSCHIHEVAVVQAFAAIGDDVVVSPGVLVCHHAVVGDHAFVASRVTILGGARIGAHSVIGASATILDGITVGRGCIIGAGAVIANNTRDEEVYISHRPERIPRTSTEFAPFLTWSTDKRRPAPGNIQDDGGE